MYQTNMAKKNNQPKTLPNVATVERLLSDFGFDTGAEVLTGQRERVAVPFALDTAGDCLIGFFEESFQFPSPKNPDAKNTAYVFTPKFVRNAEPVTCDEPEYTHPGGDISPDELPEHALVFGSVVLDRAMAEVAKGDEVMITFDGTVPTKDGKRTVKTYTVRLKRKPV